MTDWMQLNVLQHKKVFEPLDEEALKERTDIHGDDWCPLHRFIGNDKARSRLARACYSALKKPDHSMGAFSFALIGPASSGKTSLAQLVARTVDLPFVEIEPKSVKTINDLLEKISDVLQDTPSNDGNTLELIASQDAEGNDTNNLVLPPVIVFIDEVHNLPNGIVQGLLRATEKNDGLMITEHWEVDCREVCWIVATTERGKLFGPFESRFTKISLNLYSKEEMAEIVYLGMNKEIDFEACKLVAKYAGRVPREAIAFAEEMKAEKDRNLNASWLDAAKIIADDMEIDEFGLTKQRLKILTAVGQAPVSKDRLCTFARCQNLELEKYILPPLLDDTDESPALITINSSGCVITLAGRLELDKRGISHKFYGEQE